MAANPKLFLYVSTAIGFWILIIEAETELLSPEKYILNVRWELWNIIPLPKKYWIMYWKFIENWKFIIFYVCYYLSQFCSLDYVPL